MKMKWFIGIDVSKKTLDIAVLNENEFIQHQQIENNFKAIKLFLKQLKESYGFSVNEALFCMEHTGIYNTPFLEAKEKLSLNLCLESATQIKLSIGLQRGKNDKVDAKRIAEYILRNRDNIKLWTPPRGSVKVLKKLMLVRTRLIKGIQGLCKVSKENDSFETKLCIGKYFKPSIEIMKRDLKKVEKEIQKVIQEDPELKRLYSIIESVKGVGPVLAANMIITTNEFRDIKDPKKYACYAGVAPFEYSSGSSIRGRKKVSPKANMDMKSILHMAALVAIQSNKEIRDYYQHKIKQGKAKMNVINAVRNKIIHRIFACVRDNRKYENNYTSVLA